VLTKTVSVTQVKAGPDDGLAEGQFEALVSVFGNKDSYGDVVMPGAFIDTLAEWQASGNPIPVIFSHGYSDPDNHIGVVLEAAEKSVGGKSGLWVKGQLDTDPEDTRARKVGRLLKGRRVTQFSFSYDVVDGGSVEKDGEHVYELRKLKLYEVGPCLIGANSETELIGAKTRLDQLEQSLRDLAAGKAGRVLSAANEKAIGAAVEKINGGLEDLRGVLAQVQQDSNDGKATADADGKDEAPDGGKSEDPTTLTPAERLVLLSLELD
jgi:HK97 family phage prohead protease